MVARAVWMRRAPGLIRRRAGKMHRRNLAELRRFAHGSIGSPFRSDALGGSWVFQPVDRLDDVAKLVRHFVEPIVFLGDVLRGMAGEIPTDFLARQLGQAVPGPA